MGKIRESKGFMMNLSLLLEGEDIKSSGPTVDQPIASSPEKMMICLSGYSKGPS